MPAQNKRREFVCKHCNRPFTVKPSRGEPEFCSQVCRKAYHSETLTCPQCGKVFTARKCMHQKYCSIGCGTTARNLADNPMLHHDNSGPNNPMYGKPGRRGAENGMYHKYGAENPAYRTGRKRHPDGYWWVLAPPDHPCRVENPGSNYLLEHRLVMEQHLGRLLEPDEVIHHIDGNPSNNAIENLRLCASQSEHVHEHPEWWQHSGTRGEK